MNNLYGSWIGVWEDRLFYGQIEFANSIIERIEKQRTTNNERQTEIPGTPSGYWRLNLLCKNDNLLKYNETYVSTKPAEAR